MPKFDAARTACNPDGEGIRDGAAYWAVDAGSRPVMADGSLYNVVGTDTGRSDLAGRNPVTAEQRFRTHVSGPIPNRPPTADDGRVFLTSYEVTQAFDADSGERAWRVGELESINHPAVSGGSVFVSGRRVADDQPVVQARAPDDGALLWTESRVRESHVMPALGPETLFVASRGGIQAMDRATGELRFSTAYDGRPGSPPVVSDGSVFLVVWTAERGLLLKLDADSGTQAWTAPVTESNLVVGADTVYVVKEGGLVAIGKRDGEPVAAGLTDVVPVAAVGSALYAHDFDTLYAFDRENGLEERWSMTFPTWGHHLRVSISGVTAVSGAVYVANGPVLVALGPADGVSGAPGD